MGDLGDLKMLCRAAGVAGATTVGINPLHALFASEPRHTSPYSPSSRTMLDYLYIDPTAVPGFTPDMASENALAPLRATDLVDHAAVAALKRPVLEALYRRLGNSENAAFREFRKHGGRALAAFATFEALHEKLNGERGLFSWHDWPPELRDPNSTAVAKFAKQHRDRVGFF
jgi:4-alpha-glucanotransferase